jgi:hypothetical protein
LDARGFIFAPALSLRLNIRFVPVRKRGKLPGECVQAKYVKEYGEDIFELQKDRLSPSDRVVVVDDLIATGNPVPDDVNDRWVGESNWRNCQTTWCANVGICVHHGIDVSIWMEECRRPSVETRHGE